MLGPVGAPPPFVRLLVDTAPPFGLLLPIVALLRALSCARCCAASCSSARGGQMSLMPRLVGAPPPFVQPLAGASMPCVLPYLIAPLLLFDVCGVSRLLCRLLLLRSWGSAAALAWVRGRSPALCATVRARFATCAPMLSAAPALAAVSFDVTLPPPALLLPRPRCRLCLSSHVLPRP